MQLEKQTDEREERNGERADSEATFEHGRRSLRGQKARGNARAARAKAAAAGASVVL